LEDSAGPTIGVLSPYLSGYFYGALVSAVENVAAGAGGRVIAIQTAGPVIDNQGGRAPERLDRVAWERAAGFVSIGKAVPRDYLDALCDSGKALVILSHQEPGLPCPAVMADNRGGVAAAVEHLLEHGHERIAFAGCMAQFDIQERYAAYQNTLAAHGIEPDPTLFFEARDNMEPGGSGAAAEMMAAGLPCSAVVAGDDFNAIGIMAELKRAGYRVPRDQAVIGFDDMPGVSALSPGLSSVSQRFDVMGATAAQLLLRLLAGETVGPGPYVVDAAFVARESCGCTASPGSWGSIEPERWGDPIAGFTEVLREAIAGAPALAFPEGAVAQLASEVQGAFGHAASHELTSLELFDLRQACQDLYALCPGQSTSNAILALAHQLSSGLSTQGRPAGKRRLDSLLRLNSCVAEVRLAISQALLNERNNAYYDLRQSIRNVNAISMNLLRGHTEDPTSLSWLAQTSAITGVLALSRQEGRGNKDDVHDQSPVPVGSTPERRHGSGGDRLEPQPRDSELVVSGTFDAKGAQLKLDSCSYRPEDFPPAGLFDSAGPGDLVLVFPVRSEDTDWGYLAVAAPVDSSFLGDDALYEWEALLCEALGYRDLLDSVRDSDERYALASRATNDGLWDWNLVAGTIYYSSRWKEMLGQSEDAVGDSPEEWIGRAHPDDRPGLLAELSALKGGEKVSVMYEHRVMANDGTYLWVLCRCLAVPGGGVPATRIVGSFTDITDRRTLEERLRHEALFDSLTGLPNRVLFLDRLAQAVATAKRQRGYSYTVLWLDLDNFKELNDGLGHPLGDKVLVEVAERLRHDLREADTAARFGGDEFALLLQDVSDLPTVERLVQRLLGRLRVPYELDGHRVVVTASVGVATSTAGYERPEDVLRDADIAMYRVKSTGRDTYST
jgi:diguanylate cyclase (GGDEF)-like protein/PAS domain S-box-containing protein